MANIPVSNTTTPSMSSREIAELVESRHDTVKKSIERLIERGVIQSPPLANFKNINNVDGQEYLINKRDSYIIVAQLSPEFTAKLVDRWQELETGQFAIPTTLSGALRLAAEQAEHIEHLQLQAAADAPKIEFAMAVRNMQGACKLGDFGKVIGVGRNTLFKWLREDEILMGDNMPYEPYRKNGCFVVTEQTPYIDRDGKAHPTFTTMLTGKGQVWLEKKYRNKAGD